MSGAPPPLPSRAGRPDPPSVSTLPRRGPTSASRPQSAQSPRNRRGSSDDLPPPPPRNRHDPLPPVPPSTANIPIPQVNQRPSSSTLPRNSRSESNLQSHDAPPRLPPRRGTSFHGPHSSNVRPNLTNGAIPAPIQESQDLESRFMFHDVNELPAPPEFKAVKKKYSSQEYERHKRQKRTPEPRYDWNWIRASVKHESNIYKCTENTNMQIQYFYDYLGWVEFIVINGIITFRGSISFFVNNCSTLLCWWNCGDHLLFNFTL